MFVPRPLTGEERTAAWRAANFCGATSLQESPLALWILGPSSVGKSTLTARLGARFGIQAAREEDRINRVQDERCALDAVVVDGEFMRCAHGVYQSWVKTADWRSAYPALKSIINKEKDMMCTEAIVERKHMVIPQTLLNLQKGLDQVEELTCNGYTNHVVAVVAPLEECQKRGTSREAKTGKRYEAREYERSIAAIPSVICACNGRFEIVRALEQGCEERVLDLQVLMSGVCGQHEEENSGESHSERASQERIFAVLSAAVNGGTHYDVRSSASPSARPSRAPSWIFDTLSLPRQFTAEERQAAWRAANFYGVEGGHEKPMALWIIGPPFVGKSTLAEQITPDFSIPLSAPAEERCHVKGVVVDGRFIRESCADCHSPTNIHKRASASVMRSTVVKEKDSMLTEAVSQRKHLVIGRRMTDLNKGLTEMEELKWHGYTNHVIAVVSPLEECQQRAAANGRTCDSYDYEQAIDAIPAMVKACNGQFEVVEAVQLEHGGLEFRVHGRGQGPDCRESATSLAFAPHTLDEAVQAAINLCLGRG